MRQRSLLSQVLFVNLLLIVASVTVAAAAVSTGSGAMTRGREGVVALLAVTATLLGNWLLLRRRFQPLDRVLRAMEQIDLRHPDTGALEPPGATVEVRRLDAALRRMIDRLEAERVEAGRAVLQAQERERRRIAQDLHDEVNQALTAVSLRLQATITQAPEELGEELRETKELVGQAMRELLALARQLRPTILDDHGLVAALRAQVRDFGAQTGIAADFSLEGDPARLRSEQELVIYRVVQESLSNVARHAGARRVRVTLQCGSGTALVVNDDGRGFLPDGLVDPGLGLSGMRERARLTGGRLAVRSEPGHGTRVELAFA